MIHVVDDDPSFLKAVSRILKAGGYTVKSFASAAEFLAYRAPDIPGCILLDLTMPEQTGLDLQVKLSQADHQLPIVFLTGHGDIPSTVHAMREGAVDFLTKPVKKQDLFVAVKRALARDAEERVKRERLRRLRVRLDALTPREREVLAHVVSGKLNKQIAADLGTTERTIKAHRAGIMSKLGVKSVAELVRFAGELGIEPAK